ncbi:HD domain-containing phosphohydrolase [uncultured Aquitalea sp.]|uniref:HD-GYP domain-containing protein n=1 Tax=uncultured Aquitalea sp. TaxID=540272 RepID=UPI0025FC247F|nr:HD domain-containing phosphohydrolase [uncultured Aquitalea sp.]
MPSRLPDLKKQLQDKVVPEQINVGKELALDVYARNGILLLSKGHYVLTGLQREKLLEMGYTADGQRIEPPALEQAERPENPHENVLHEMAFLQQRTRTLLKYSLQLPDFSQRVARLSNDVIDLAESHPDGVIASLLLVPFKEYGPAHALHTAALLALLTRRMPLSEEQRHSVLGAALTMNMSISDLQNQLHHQQEALSPEQEQQIESHPLVSSAILREAGVEDELWHWLVQTHHESWLGNGYPYGLARQEIQSLSHILHIADITCAKLTPRSYRPGLLPATALGHLFKRKDIEFDPAITTLLIKELGIYPPGSFVKLASNEIGVVLARRPKASEPQVAALRKLDGPAYIDALIRETSNPAHKVLAPCPATMAGVRASHLARLWRGQHGHA